jgi:predicted branched-subunit amino acid permease
MPRTWTPEQAAAFRSGAVTVGPLVVGFVPWGVVVGLAMVSAGLTSGQAVGMSVLVFAGASQIAVLPLLIAGAPLWVMYVTALVVNLRYVIYSAVLAPYFGRLPWVWRALLSYVTVDGVFALFIGRFRPSDDEPTRHWFYLGGCLLSYVVWQISSWIGIFGGALIPRDWSLDFAGTLALVALIIPLLYDRAVVCGALAAGVVSVAAAGLPLNLGVLAAIATGVLVGLAVTRLAPVAPVQESSHGA